MMLEDKPLNHPDIVRLDALYGGQSDRLQPELAPSFGRPGVDVRRSVPSSE